MAEPPGLPSGVAAVVVSHESREDVRRETLAHLAQEGIHPLVKIDVGESEARDVRRAGLEALQSVPWEAGVLFLEDDVRLRTGWRRILDLAVEVDAPTVLCTLELQVIPRPWCDWIRDDPRAVHTVKPRVVPMARAGVFYGVQCVYMPTWFLHVLTTDEVATDFSHQRRGMALDSALHNLANRAPGATSMAIAIPDMAQHLSPPGVRNAGRHKRHAHMFHWRLA